MFFLLCLREERSRFFESLERGKAHLFLVFLTISSITDKDCFECVGLFALRWLFNHTEFTFSLRRLWQWCLSKEDLPFSSTLFMHYLGKLQLLGASLNYFSMCRRGFVRTIDLLWPCALWCCLSHAKAVHLNLPLVCVLQWTKWHLWGCYLRSIVFRYVWVEKIDAHTFVGCFWNSCAFLSIISMMPGFMGAGKCTASYLWCRSLEWAEEWLLWLLWVLGSLQIDYIKTCRVWYLTGCQFYNDLELYQYIYNL